MNTSVSGYATLCNILLNFSDFKENRKNSILASKALLPLGKGINECSKMSFESHLRLDPVLGWQRPFNLFEIGMASKIVL